MNPGSGEPKVAQKYTNPFELQQSLAVNLGKFGFSGEIEPPEHGQNPPIIAPKRGNSLTDGAFHGTRPARYAMA